MESLVNSPWAYWALGLSTWVTEELAPILGGIAANEGELDVTKVIVAISIGGWLFTLTLYTLGRLKWDGIRRRWPRTRATGTVALRVVARNPISASLFVRFAFGLRLVLPMACGAARVPLAIYLPATAAGSIVWTVLFTAIGYAAGEAAVRMMGHFGRVGQVIGAILVTALVLGFLRWNKRRTERKQKKRNDAAKRATTEAEASTRVAKEHRAP